MSHRILRTSAVCLLMAASSALYAQRVFVSPGAGQASENIEVLTTPPLTNITGFQTGAGVFKVLGLPDGSKFYAIGSSSSQTVTKVDSAFQLPEAIAAYQQPATAAILTPDGTRLAVAAGTLHIFDTSTDLELVPGGINAGAGVTISDVAVSLDGKMFYTLGTSNGTTQINAIEVAGNLVTGTMGFRGTANSISVGPNGLVYVTLASEIIDINPNTFTQNPAGPIAINGTPGRPAFTTDGQYALFSNQTPNTGSSLILVSLASRTVAATTPSLEIALDTLLVTGTNSILGYASSAQTAYQITIGVGGALSISLFNVPSMSSPGAFAISNEVPTNGVPYVNSLYAAGLVGTNNAVEQLNPQGGQEKGIATIPSAVPAGALSFTRSAMTNEQPIILLQYGGGQTLAPSTTSLPVVVRVLDTNALPISGVPVNFTASGPGASVSPASVVTTSTGYAVTYLNSGATAGAAQITATAGTKTAIFDFTVSSTTASSPQGLTFVAGQGQILPAGDGSNTQVGSPLSVMVSDQNGNPVPNTPVTFLVTSGGATLTAGGLGGSQQVATTDADGVASVNFSTPQLTGNDLSRDFGQIQVVASATGTNTLTFTITTYPNFPNSLAPSIQQLQPQISTPITAQVNQTIPGAIL
jgi:Bacterial Ig-like domain (group 1)